jgi:hypothetical protein
VRARQDAYFGAARLKKYGYPPDLAKDAIRAVIAQAEAVLSEVS